MENETKSEAPQAVTKKKRGRPRKNPDVVSESVSSEALNAALKSIDGIPSAPPPNLASDMARIQGDSPQFGSVVVEAVTKSGRAGYDYEVNSAYRGGPNKYTNLFRMCVKDLPKNGFFLADDNFNHLMLQLAALWDTSYEDRKAELRGH